MFTAREGSLTAGSFVCIRPKQMTLWTGNVTQHSAVHVWKSILICFDKESHRINSILWILSYRTVGHGSRQEFQALSVNWTTNTSSGVTWGWHTSCWKQSHFLVYLRCSVQYTVGSELHNIWHHKCLRFPNPPSRSRCQNSSSHKYQNNYNLHEAPGFTRRHEDKTTFN